MQPQASAPVRRPRNVRGRPARRYRTCTEALAAVRELELLAEDEVSWLRSRGLEAEADRQADAWRREINRALGEAEALRQARPPSPRPGVNRSPMRERATGQPQLPARLAVLVFTGRLIARAFRCSPRLTSCGLLLAIWALAALLRALAPFVGLIDLAGWTAVFGLVAAGAIEGWRQR